ncbi:hypothetical protein [Gelidibacter algens]|uniref:hypothetical protein n=1 Tax=Gelidibacter algens TaxID=49280 RepID=UPI0012F94032|nr:hypothetical protein [Gelidibacter algens]
MDKNQRRKIDEPTAKICLAELDRLIIVNHTKRKLEKDRPYKSQGHASSGMNTS